MEALTAKVTFAVSWVRSAATAISPSNRAVLTILLPEVFE